MKKIFILFVLLSNAVFGQEQTLWSSLSPQATETVYPPTLTVAKYHAIRLNTKALASLQTNVPMETNQANMASNTVLSLPMPNGTFEPFKIVESPILAAQVAAQHPNIKTYAGISTQNPNLTTRITISDMGLHAIVLGGKQGTVYVMPLFAAKQRTPHRLLPKR